MRERPSREPHSKRRAAGRRFVTSEPTRDSRSARLFTQEWVPESFILGADSCMENAKRRLLGINVQLLGIEVMSPYRTSIRGHVR